MFPPPVEKYVSELMAGVKATQANILCFVDADLLGLRGEHIDAIVKPVLDGNCEAILQRQCSDLGCVCLRQGPDA